MGVFGELLITAGVVVLLYVVWQMWIGDMIYGAQQRSEAQSLSQERAAQEPPPVLPEEGEPIAVDPPVLAEAGDGEIFGIVHIPRFGAGYSVNLAGGVSRQVTLDPIGIGHYPGTAMPGGVGNFAVAGHRGSHGAPFENLPALHVGDPIVIETPEGWYVYRFRSMEYVPPTAVDVLLPVPREPDAAPTERLITLTTCSPRWGSAERLIAYGVFDSFAPRAEGPPPALTGEVPA